MKKALFITLLGMGMAPSLCTAQLGKVQAPGNAAVFDPNGDGNVSIYSTGFNPGAGYTVDQFEIPMFGLPIVGDGDIVGDASGPSCSNTDLAPDQRGYSAYAILKNGNLIFRFRVANHANNVPGYSVLIDTDGKLGPSDPDYVAGSRNPGFEIDITLIKGPSANAHGVKVYNINGGNNNCSAILSYPISTHHQRAIGDLIGCNEYTYFYDFYVPFADLASQFNITTSTEIRFIALTNINATCAMSGSISDVGGVNDNDYPTLFDAITALSGNQCPTTLGNLAEGGGGFLEGVTKNPTFDEPIREGDRIISGTAEPTATVTINLYQNEAATEVIETKQAVADANGLWSMSFVDPLVGGMVLSAVAQLPGTCGSDSNSADPDNEVVLVEVVVVNNYPPVLTKGTGSASYTENNAGVAVDPAIDISYPAEAAYPADLKILVNATISISGNLVAAQDRLLFTNQNGISGSYDTGTGVLTLTSATPVLLSTYETALRSIKYFNNSDNPSTATRTVRFVINDGYPGGTSNAVEVNVLITAVNDAPVVAGTNPYTITYPNAGGGVAVNTSVTVSDVDNTQIQGAEIRIVNVLDGANETLQFTDPNGVITVSGFSGGVLSLTGTATVAAYQEALRNVTYSNTASPVTPNARQLSFRASDGALWSNTYNSSFIKYENFNNPPIVKNNEGLTVTDIYLESVEDTPIDICLDIQDPDADGVEISAYDANTVNNLGTNSSHGSNPLCLVFTPFANKAGTDEFTMTICDQPSVGTSKCVVITVHLTINAVNDPPSVVEKTVNVNEKETTAISFDVTDPDGDVNTFSSVSSTKATVVITGNYTFNYTPKNAFVGTDVVKVKVSDPSDATLFDEGDITVNVLDLPEAPIILGDNSVQGANVNVTAVKNKSVNFCFSAFDPDKDDQVEFKSATKRSSDGSIITYLPSFSGPPSGNRPFCFTFKPEANFTGISEWQMTICDKSDPLSPKCSTVTVFVNVKEFNYPPEVLIAGKTDLTVLLPEKTTSSICLETNDLEGDEHFVNSGVSLDNIGGINLGTTPSLCVAYTPPIDFIGKDEVEVVVCDIVDNGTCTTEIIEVVVYDVNEPPAAFKNGVVVTTLNLSTQEDTPAQVCFQAVDPEGDDVSLQKLTNVSGGGTLQVLASEKFCLAFTPPADFFGTSTWEVNICDDASPSLCSKLQVVIEVAPINDSPVIQSKVVTVTEKVTTPVCIEFTDKENDLHHFAGGQSVDNIGSINDGTAGDLCFDYTPPEGFIGEDIIEVSVCDLSDGSVCGTGFITMNVVEYNEPPIKLIDGVPGDTLRITTAEDVPVEFCFDTSDPDGDNVLVNAITNLQGGGTITPVGTGPFCYSLAPAANFFGQSVWELDICDDASSPLCVQLIVVANVTPVNDAPVAERDTLIAMRNKVTNGNLLDNDWDLEGDDVVVNTVPVVGPAHGQATIFSDGTVSYRSNVDFRGIDSLVYEVYDTGEPNARSTGVAVFVVEDLPFKVYQTISPNGDGINDYWHIEGIDYYTSNVIRIFDRFNNIVYEIDGYNNADKAWTGQSNRGLGNKNLADGTYYYSISLGPAQKTYSGFIVLKYN